jgi:hypothetical protein
VAELEATTVRKGNKKVSVTLSGWVVKTMNWWDDGDLNHVVIGDKDADLSSRFAITGSATIAPGWSAGYNLTVVTDGDIYGIGSNQEADLTGGGTDIRTLYSFIYIKSDKWGALNWGTLSPASDNPAVLADISGTVIESNAVGFEGPGFFLRPKGSGLGGDAGLVNANWGDFLLCQGLGAGIGADCFGGPQAAVRYDSPTWGGFRFETSYGENQGLDSDLVPDNFTSEDQDFWDIAAFYTADWNSIKLSLAGAYTWIETGVANGAEDNLWQAGGSILHKPSGLGIYALGQWERPDGGGASGIGLGSVTFPNGVDVTTIPPGFICGGAPCNQGTFSLNPGGAPLIGFDAPDSDVWYVKPFWRKTWSPIGATTLFGEYGQYNDQYAAGQNLCLAGFQAGTNVGNFCNAGPFLTGAQNVPGLFEGVFVTGSEVQRWGLGVVQEIDSAAMHVFARWQHQEIDLDLVGVEFNPATGVTSTQRIGQSFDDWDLFQVGGIIFF